MEPKNHSRQLIYLFLGNATILFVGMGVFPVLPLYAAEFGASSAGIGIYLSLVNMAITVGTLLTGWIPANLWRRTVLILGGGLGIPALALLGQASAFWQVVAFTAVVWFSGGIGLGLNNQFTGLLAEPKSRGKVFSLMSLGLQLGSLAGGAAISKLVAWQGYPLMFAVLAGVWAILPLVGIFGLREIADVRPGKPAAVRASGGFGRSFALLLLVSLLAAIALAVSRFVLSLTMKAQEFSPAAAASTSAVSGLVVIPLTLLGAYFSDRLPRRHFLFFAYLLIAAEALVMSAASQLWHFWAASTLTLLAVVLSSSAASAFTVDLLAPGVLGREISWLNTTSGVASILSYTGSGVLVELAGLPSLCLLTAVLPLAAGSVLFLISPQRSSQALKADPGSEPYCQLVVCP